jgi:hypothetical protein
MDDFEKIYRKDQYHIKRWQKELDDYEKKYKEKNKDIRKELEKLLKRKKNLTPREKFICAMIYHHGFNLSCSKKALKYINESYAEGYSKEKWVKGAVIDRLLQNEGKPQKYGSQIVKLKNGRYKQYKLDGTISDEERVALGFPKLRVLKKYLES